MSDTAQHPAGPLFVVDMHSDYAIEILRQRERGNDDALHSEHLPRLREGGVRLEVLVVGGDFDIDGVEQWHPSIVRDCMQATLTAAGRHGDELCVLRTRGDLAQLRAGGAVGLLLGIEGARCLESDGALLDELFDKGLRSLILTHNHRNRFADGCSVTQPGPLSADGRVLLRRAQELGMIVDLVHLSVPAFHDALDRLDQPPIVSHSNARALCAHPRNLDDEQLRRIAAHGGVVGLNFLGIFIDERHERVTLDRLVDHAVHIASVAGVEHLGLGPDFADYYMEAMCRWLESDNLPPTYMDFVPGAADVTGIPALLEALSRRGFSADECTMIAGGNALRVYEQILHP